MSVKEAVLQVQDLSVERRGRLAVEGVSFALAAESDTALVGPNGAGKSTLVAALLGLLPHASGRVELLGQPLGANGCLPRSVRAQIAYVPQNLVIQGLIPLSVAEFVGFGFDLPGPSLPWRSGKQRTAAVLRALDRTQTCDLRKRLLTELSGGQLKRVLSAF